jgi:predicted kinase
MKIKINENQLKNLIKNSLNEQINSEKILYVLIGPPAVGKSTWIRKNLIDKSPYIISRDDIVDQVAESYGLTYDDLFATPSQNEKIGDFNEKFGEVIASPPYMKFSKTVYSKILEANNKVQDLFNERIKNSKSHNIVVVDMTNMSKFARKNALNMVDNTYKKVAVMFEFKGFEDVIKERNKKRSEELKKENKSKTIPDHVYDSMFSRFEDISKDEGFDEIINYNNFENN